MTASTTNNRKMYGMNIIKIKLMVKAKKIKEAARIVAEIEQKPCNKNKFAKNTKHFLKGNLGMSSNRRKQTWCRLARDCMSTIVFFFH